MRSAIMLYYGITLKKMQCSKTWHGMNLVGEVTLRIQHDFVILLLRPKYFSFFLLNLNLIFQRGLNNKSRNLHNLRKQTLKGSGRSYCSKMTSSGK